MAVEPTRSQKRTVRWRRSPSTVRNDSETIGGGAIVAVDSGVPHCEQKRAVGAMSALQRGQRRASGLPQLLQKRAAAGLSVVQSEQRIAHPRVRRSEDRL